MPMNKYPFWMLHMNNDEGRNISDFTIDLRGLIQYPVCCQNEVGEIRRLVSVAMMVEIMALK